jgi:hypothetical protein
MRLDADGVLDLEGQPAFRICSTPGVPAFSRSSMSAMKSWLVGADVVDRAAGADAGRQLGVVDALG